MKVYLSGPMSGLPDENFPAFNTAAKNLRASGYEVINPAEFDTDVTGLEGLARWQKYLRADIKALMDCDGIVMLSGWQYSEGAKLEHLVASQVGLKVMSLFDAFLKAKELNGMPT
jgi:hypothetical protein